MISLGAIEDTDLTSGKDASWVCAIIEVFTIAADRAFTDGQKYSAQRRQLIFGQVMVNNERLPALRFL